MRLETAGETLAYFDFAARAPIDPYVAWQYPGWPEMVWIDLVSHGRIYSGLGICGGGGYERAWEGVDGPRYGRRGSHVVGSARLDLTIFPGCTWRAWEGLAEYVCVGVCVVAFLRFRMGMGHVYIYIS